MFPKTKKKKKKLLFEDFTSSRLSGLVVRTVIPPFSENNCHHVPKQQGQWSMHEKQWEQKEKAIRRVCEGTKVD